ncbi:MAG: polysulfide reductase NrfD, partial [Desulfobacteraceae bacterium]|nr:polysulfide reductase NrfD [Desulfobacteraceae bacterium]
NLPGFLSKFNNILEKILGIADKITGKLMFLLIIAGIVLSCLHQSSLGSLMLIAPSKIHPLWYTPILPLLFLLSAFAAGYPMVVFESILVSKSFGREPEMDVLTPLAKYMPVLMGVYLTVKIMDMMARGSYVYLLDGTYQTNSFLVEMIVCVFMPFVLLLSKKVRQSPGLLFFACTVFILGIVLNRINVFVVAYTPPYKLVSYFPSIGEMFITAGLIATLMFTYRVFVTIFPVLGVEPHEMTRKKASSKTISGVGVVILAVLLVAVPNFSAHASEGQQNLRNLLPLEADITPSISDAPKVRMMNSKVINKYSDLYGPVRFMHSKHANVLNDCSICHHRMPREEGDKYGEPVTMLQLREKKQEPVSCSVCHDKPFDPKNLHTPGLKGAYHQLCM